MAAEATALEKKKNLKEIHEKLVSILRLEFDPIGVKIAFSEEDLKGVRLIKKPVYSCQLAYIAAAGGFVAGFDIKYFEEKGLLDSLCKSELVSLGYRTVEDNVKIQAKKYAKDDDIARKQLEARPKFDKPVRGLAMGPLNKIRFEPDVIVVIGTPWQMTRIGHAYAFMGKHIEMKAFFGPNAIPCSYGWYYTVITREPNIGPPCSGAKEFGKFSDIHMTISIPIEDIDLVIKGLEQTEKRGLRVPHFIDMGVPPKEPKAIFETE